MVGPEIARRIPYYEGLRLNFWHLFGTGVFLGGSILHNLASKRQISASIPKHLASVVVGYFAGTGVYNFLEDHRSQNISVIEDYICRHPEDFPRVQSKKYKDLLMPWSPVR